MECSHHSHSGQFCGHAKNTLEEMVLTAMSKGMKTFALTEHVPRAIQDLYPGESEAGVTFTSLAGLFESFVLEARRLRGKYSTPNFHILIGFESEWIRPSSLDIINRLLSKHEFDFYVGSIHHVHMTPIDFDRPLYQKARAKSGGIDMNLFEDYFDSQYDMLQALKPRIIGHFDLIRLFSDNPNQNMFVHKSVSQKIHRNLTFIAQYGGILEINSSALRKGLSEPYPQATICQAFMSLGGSFTLSDDSHGIDQVGLDYHEVLDFIKRTNIQHIAVIKSKTEVETIPVKNLDDSPCWRP